MSKREAKKPLNRHPLAVAISLIPVSFLAIGAMPAMAQAKGNSSTLLPGITVTADWLGAPTKESEKTYTGARTVVENDQLQNSGALNLEDALRPVAGVTVLDETGTGILPNIGVRGLNPLRSERLQLLVDGYPIAIGPYSNVGVSLFPVTLPSLEVVDIVRGGASVHYGPNNVGGVVNMVTKPIPAETTQTLRERITIAEETGNVFTDTYYRIGGRATDKLDLQLQANIQRGDGFRDHSDTEVDNLILDARYYLNDQHELASQLQYYRVEADLPGALSPKAYKDDRTQSQRPYDGYEADMTRATFTWTYTPSDNIEFQWRNFVHDADRTFFFGQNFSSGGHWADPAEDSTLVADSPRLFTVYSTEPRLAIKHGRHDITVGARFVSEDVEFDVNRLTLANNERNVARDWHLDTRAMAFYLSDTVSFLDDRLTVTPGIRYEDVAMDFQDNLNNQKEKNNAEEWLPGLTVGLQASDDLFVFANSQRSLVPVQIAQTTREGEVANETAWNHELGARFQVTPDLLSSATLFRIDYEDQIQFNRANSRYENLGETRHQGIELSNRLYLNNAWELGLGYTFLDTEQLTGDNEGNELPNAPRHKVSADAVYNYQAWDARVNWVYVSSSYSDADNTEQETDNGSAGKLPHYHLVNARVGRDFAMGSGNVLNLGLAVNNLLDEDYYFRGVDVSPVGRVPQPGRSFVLEAQLDF
ncbi:MULTISPECIES: TonB-dependent receptor family protein [unclassified Marinobacter]|uniref:TonB-dependent receptor family protein n=1 Tax=unclassified Marinobacter TaxID=83889 RepID=UPI00273B57CB|nr:MULTISPECIES: TonB-dependent siderophore receptor [unclassified Marinobacter]MDP4546208.1 TonB-dependent siderophore receptor [Marinobacter sp. MDS2]